MRLNPNFFGIFTFLLIGLIWSGGHTGWIIAMGIHVFLACVVAPNIPDPKRPTRPSGRQR